MAAITYLDFDLEIGAGNGLEYPVTVHSPAGEAQATLRWTLSGLALENRLKDLQIALLSSGGQRRATLSCEEATVQQFGGELFDALITDEVRSRYDVIQSQAQREGKGVRLRLHIDPPPLASLPWEFLYDQRNGEYVSLSRHTPIVRYLKLPHPVSALPVQPPLRILGLIASPSDLPALDVAVERQRIERAIALLQERGLLELTWLSAPVPGGTPQPTWRDLQRAMNGGPWHIFHFVGHGDYDPQRDEGRIALAGDNGKAHFFTARELARLLADQKALRLVVLNACKGAAGGQQDRFASSAAALVRRGIPAVIAMQYPITDYAAIEFAQSFYEQLTSGLPIDAAVVEARKAVSFAIANTVEWGTPVLYMRSSDGYLFDVVMPEAPPTHQPAQAQPTATLPDPKPSAQTPVRAPEAGQTDTTADATTKAQPSPGLKPTGAATTAATDAKAPQATGSVAPDAERAASPAKRTLTVQKSPKKRNWWGIGLGLVGVLVLLYASLTGYQSYQVNQRQIQVTVTAMVSQDAAALRVLSERFGMAFVPVPGGTFLLGSPDGIGDSDEQPQHEVTVANFWIGQTEVTNAQYRHFVEAGGYTQESLWTPEGWQWRTENNVTQPAYWDDTTWNGDDYPVVGVSWYEATAFATWLSQETGLTVRLPSEAEWERAARGGDGRIYPWGDAEPNEGLLNYNDNLGHTRAVDSYPYGASPYGALNMAGNVWEWTSSRYVGYPYVDDDGREELTGTDTRTLRGGSWSVNASVVRSPNRYRIDPDFRISNVGLRLVVSPGF